MYGSGMNFYGGPGESAHKMFVKAPGQKTQRRVSEFAKQMANQYYSMMLTDVAIQSCLAETSQLTQSCGNVNNYVTTDTVQGRISIVKQTNKGQVEDVDIILSGKYKFVANTSVIKEMEQDGTVDVIWSFNETKKNDNRQFNLHRDLVRVIHRRLTEDDINSLDYEKYSRIVYGYTKHCLSQYQTNKLYSTHILTFKEMSGMIGQRYILKRKIIRDS